MDAGGNVTRINPVAGRQCGTCTLCCRVMAVSEIEKPPGKLCTHCDEGRGCRIYDTRPRQCRTFQCHFLENTSLREEWRPSKSRIILVVSPDGQRIGAHVDPERPGAWRREPFYSTLKVWAREALSREGQIGQVYVTIGNRTIVILPDRNVDMGIVESDEIVVTRKQYGPGGVTYEAFKIKRDEPQAAAILGEIEKGAHNGPIF
jgi:hypothetical protein